MTKLRAAARERQQPDWPRLQAMIRELCERKGWVEADGDLNLYRLGAAVGQPSRYYQWMRTEQPSVKPSADSLKALAQVAASEPHRVPHLAQESRWLEAGGIIKRVDGGRLTDAQHDVVDDMAHLPMDLQAEIWRFVHQYRKAWERAHMQAMQPTQPANGTDGV